MKIVVLDGYTLNPGDLSWEALGALGEYRVYERTSLTDVDEIVSRIGDADAVFTNKTPIPTQVIEQCSKLKFIGVLATGYNIVDVVAAAKKQIVVTNVPAYGTAAVSQFAIALLMEICHHIGHHNQAVHEGRWEQNADWCFWDYPLIELEGKTMGIVGFGRIGQTTGRIAQALGMKILAYDVFPNPELENRSCQYAQLEDVLQKSDILALHCPLFSETEGMINKETIQKMKDGVIILNNSRGPLIVEKDLAEALVSGKVAAAGLDVVSTEPISKDNPLLKAPNCLITPHISWAPVEARQRLMDAAIYNLKMYIEGKPSNTVQ